MFSTAYRLLTDLGSPVIDLYLRRRLARGREDAARFAERLGQSSQPRPPGRLIWCHAASLGEAASLLALIENLRRAYPETRVLVTTGTVTSARMLEGRLPPGAVHQYMPVDRAPYIKRFLDHWRPDFALWIESELWPNTLTELRARKVPAVLINARMSDQSFRNWSFVKSWARELLGTFSLCLTQTEDARMRFAALGADPVRCVGNLKYAGKPLPFDEHMLAQLKASITSRPLWLMASTHRGEEEMALEAHRKLREKFPQILTIIVPRHAVRGADIAAKIAESGLVFAQRSKGEAITPETQIYLADTMGELGLFYRLSPVAVIGGSFVDIGGHNPIEPAQLGAAIIFGPHMQNFAEIAHEFMERNAAIGLQSAEHIAAAVDRLLAEPVMRERVARAASELAAEKSHVLDRIMEELTPWLGQVPNAERRPLEAKASA